MCTSTTCSGDGTCVEAPGLPGGFYCVCNSGFTGTQCEIGKSVVLTIQL